MIYKALYKKDSTNKIRIWYIEQIADKYRVYNGVKDGNLVISNWTIAVPKNEGKSNATTGEQQATSEIESEYTKKKKRGYTEDITNTNKRKFQCTLAKEYVKYEDKVDFKSQNWIAQIKFNGCRCNITKNGAFSRTGEKFLTVNHIIKELDDLFVVYPDAVLDGELFNYDLRENLNELMSIVRKSVNIKQEDFNRSKELVQFHIYDGFLNIGDDKKNYNERYSAVLEVIKDLEFTIPVESLHITDKTILDEFYKKNLSEKQEGIILRNIDVPYEQKRSKNLLKYKPVDDDEAYIVKVLEGNGNWANTAKTAKLKWNGKEFDATFLGTQSELKKIWKEKESWKNRKIKFLYNGFTGLGTPNHARIDLKNCSEFK
jgi:DNA ligase 1